MKSTNICKHVKSQNITFLVLNKEPFSDLTSFFYIYAKNEYEMIFVAFSTVLSPVETLGFSLVIFVLEIGKRIIVKTQVPI